MNAEERARESGLVRPEHVGSLIRSLKSQRYGWLVSDPTDDRLQGDLLSAMPVALIDQEGNPRLRRRTAMVMNAACDLQPGQAEAITVAPVHEFDRYVEFVKSSATSPELAERAKSHLESVQANEINDMLYIPHCSQLPNGGIVRLDSLCSMNAAVYERALSGGQRFASLTRNGFYYLLMKLTWFFARPEPADVRRETSE